MKISRVINWEAVEIELTHDEIFMAYCEQEHKFDVDDVDTELDKYEGDGADGASAFLEEYGITVEQARRNIHRIAYEKRRNMDKYDMDWWYALMDAIRTIANEIKKQEAS